MRHTPIVACEGAVQASKPNPVNGPGVTVVARAPDGTARVRPAATTNAPVRSEKTLRMMSVVCSA